METTTKHTKGEWSIDKYNSLSCNGKTIIVNACIGMTFHEDEEAQANAKLIAAAPDMLEYLIDIKSTIDGGGDIVTFTPHYIERLNNLITKATK